MSLRITLFALLALAFPLAQAQLVQDTHYALVDPPQQPQTQGKVEVLEFFSHSCPYCYHLNAQLDEWEQSLSKDAVLIRVPISLGRREWGQQVRAYYALDQLGQARRLNAVLFDAIHEKGERLFDLDALASWAARNGVDEARFREAFNSEEVTAKASRAEQLSREYRVRGVPSLVVAGKYRALGSNFPEMLTITTQLIERAAKE